MAIVRSSLVEGGITRGDAFPIRRWVIVPTGLTVTKAWLTIKADIDDDDGSALVQKTITSSNVAGTGQIEKTGAALGRALLRFDFVNTDTGALSAGEDHYWDLQVLLSDGQRHTLEGGMVSALAEVTETTV